MIRFTNHNMKCARFKILPDNGTHQLHWGGDGHAQAEAIRKLVVKDDEDEEREDLMRHHYVSSSRQWGHTLTGCQQAWAASPNLPTPNLFIKECFGTWKIYVLPDRLLFIFSQWQIKQILMINIVIILLNRKIFSPKDYLIHSLVSILKGHYIVDETLIPCILL